MSRLRKVLSLLPATIALVLWCCDAHSEAKKAPATGDPKAIRETPADTSALSAQDPTKHGLDY